MFSTGQLIFAVLFVIAFVITAIYSYRKDIQIHKSHYKGSYKIVLGFFIFIGLLFVIKVYLKN